MVFECVKKVAEADFPTRWGFFRILGFEGLLAEPRANCEPAAPADAAVDVPLAVFSVIQFEPGASAALQFTVPAPVALTLNDPPASPGELPVGAENCVPDGFTFIVSVPVTSSVTGIVRLPAEEFTVSVVS